MSWIFATVGLAVKDPETAQAAAFPVLAPLVFASAAFVPVENMPGWLQPWARNQPVSVTVETFRALTLGGPTSSLVIKTILWSVADHRDLRAHRGAPVPQGRLGMFVHPLIASPAGETTNQMSPMPCPFVSPGA